IEGLSENVIDKKIQKYGINEIVKEKQKPIYIQFLLAFVNPFNSILFVLAIMSLFTDIVLVHKKEKSWVSIVLTCFV
ncbi:MAG: cation-transporting P-type ATPase, partial [Cetobacterium sp.]